MGKNVLFFIVLMLQILVLRASDFDLIKDNKCADIYYADNEQVVNTAVEMFIADSKLVAAVPAQKVNTITDRTIVVGVLNKETWFMQLVSQYKIDFSDMENK